MIAYLDASVVLRLVLGDPHHLKDAPGGHHFVVLDAGMTELMRPMLYGAFHRIVAVTPRAARDVSYDIVGPVCESTDMFGSDRRLKLRRPAGDGKTIETDVKLDDRVKANDVIFVKESLF